MKPKPKPQRREIMVLIAMGKAKTMRITSTARVQGNRSDLVKSGC